MKKFIITELRKRVNQLLTEEKIDDFFKFLAKDPNNKSMASVMYTNPVKVNKFIFKTNTDVITASSADPNFAQSMLDASVKVPNPMFDKLYKNTRFMFRWQDTYKQAMDRVNPEHEMGERRGIYDKVEGFEVLEMGKSGLYLPIIPTGSESTYSVFDNGQWSTISKEEAYQYMPKASGVNPNAIPMRALIVDRIYKIKSGGHEWLNPHFKYKYLGFGQ
jgi:hypothetical protein